MTEAVRSRGIERIAELERVPLGVWPTPLERLDGLSELLGIELWAKRDDVTTFALGGNKVRKLEFLLGHARAQGCDAIVTTGGSQSNHARITAAACARHGFECHLVLDRGRHPDNGNLLLDHLFDASVHLIEDSEPAAAIPVMQQLADELQSDGRKPMILPRGGSVPQGAVGYANMVLELDVQLQDANFKPDLLVVATGSCGTHSGIMAGRELVRAQWPVQGFSVSRPRDVQEARVVELGNQTLEWLGAEERIQPESARVDDGFTGPAYGIPIEGTWAAITTAARSDGIVLDPVYTGKAFDGLLNLVRSERIAAGSQVVFVHTGGSPALFAYASETASAVAATE